jgi:hypothetical protein
MCVLVGTFLNNYLVTLQYSCVMTFFLNIKDAPINDEKFWVDLLHEKVTPTEELNDFPNNTNSKTENLGRGMRARREVFHFGHNNSRSSEIIDGFTDDDDVDHRDEDCDDDDDEANSDMEQVH